ncbi:MAG: phosphoribosyltransferase [Ruminococcaceae bacterium]|nr:phosphoribosyltransferase [Oscillospiraceae bacterium]
MAIGTTYKIKTKNKDLYLRVTPGHFATSHSHINYFIDVTTQKMRLSEASAVAKELVGYYNTSSIVDTILCLDGTEVIGTCLAQELTSGHFRNMNAHQTIYVVTPEHTSGSQLIFRDNTASMISGKHILILAASVTTGYTAQAAVEAIRYYGGHVAGICSLFATLDSCAGYPVYSAFDLQDLPDYVSAPSHECPFCKKGERVDALVNSFGYSKL